MHLISKTLVIAIRDFRCTSNQKEIKILPPLKHSSLTNVKSLSFFVKECSAASPAGLYVRRAISRLAYHSLAHSSGSTSELHTLKCFLGVFFFFHHAETVFQWDKGLCCNTSHVLPKVRFRNAASPLLSSTRLDSIALIVCRWNVNVEWG